MDEMLLTEREAVRRKDLHEIKFGNWNSWFTSPWLRLYRVVGGVEIIVFRDPDLGTGG